MTNGMVRWMNSRYVSYRVFRWMGLILLFSHVPVLAQGESSRGLAVTASQALGDALPDMPRAEAPVETVVDSTVLAVVGNEPILMSDVQTWVRGIIAENLLTFVTEAIPEREKQLGEKITPQELQKAEEDLVREQLRQCREPKTMRTFLDQFIETKLLLINLRRTIPADGLDKFMAGNEKMFDEEIMPAVLAKKKLHSAEEMDAWYRRAGTDFASVRKIQVEINITQGWISELLKKEIQTDISYNEMLRYYQEHPEDFTSVASAKWEQLSVNARGPMLRNEDIAKLAKMGNAVMEGEPFAEVAKRDSQGPTAEIGGTRDWTKPGMLTSAVLDRAIFSLPVGAMSPILEDSQGFHIIRVVERKDAVKQPFEDVQSQIKNKILEQRSQGVRDAIFERLRKEIPVQDFYQTRESH